MEREREGGRKRIYNTWEKVKLFSVCLSKDHIHHSQKNLEPIKQKMLYSAIIIIIVKNKAFYKMLKKKTPKQFFLMRLYSSIKLDKSTFYHDQIFYRKSVTLSRILFYFYKRL